MCEWRSLEPTAPVPHATLLESPNQGKRYVGGGSLLLSFSFTVLFHFFFGLPLFPCLSVGSPSLQRCGKCETEDVVG